MRPEWGHHKPTRHKPTRVRRLLLISGAAVITLGVATLVGLFVIYPRVGAAAIRDKMLPKLSARIGHAVTVEGVDVSLGRAVLTGVKITDDEGTELAVVPRVVMRFGVGASLLGNIDLDSVVADDARLISVVARDGSTSWDEMRAWLSRKSAGSKGGRGSGLIPRRAELHGASYEVRDHRRGMTAVGEGFDARLEAGRLEATTAELTVMSRLGPRADLRGVAMSGKVRELGDTAELTIADGRLTLWPGMRLTGVAGTIAPASTGKGLWIDLSGGWGGSEGRVWKAVGNFDPMSRRGNLKIGAEKFELERIASVLGDTPLRDIDDTSLGVELNIASDGKTITTSGSVAFDKLSFFHPKLATDTIEDVSASGVLEASYDLEKHELQLSNAKLSSGGVEYQLEGMVRLGEERLLDELHFRLRIPAVPCQTMLASLPAALVPRLQGFELRGTFDTDVTVHVPWDRLEDTTLQGSVGIRKCDVTRAAKGMSAGKLKGSFKHQIIVGFDDGEPVRKTMTVGPESASYVPLSAISPYLVNSLLTTEDSSFFRHRGFIVSEFRSALIKNLEAGFFRYGASSITMQLVKNVYLDREKTASRKLQELFMTWYVETKVPKTRLMEVYLNAIEYGPALYGIGNAAKRYFGKPASQISPTEAAFFSSILPSPRRRYRQYCRDKISSWTERKIERILGIMLKRNRLTQAEYETAMATPLMFRMEKTGCRGR